VNARPTITATLVCRHEEAVVERCLSSLRDLVDEIIVIHDGPCEDRTLEIAASMGARTAELPLVGHAERHTVTAYEWATGDWIISIDADEFLSDELRRELHGLVARDDVNGYEFLWRMWDGTRYITERGPYKLSLFRRSALHVGGLIHSVEQVDPPVVRSDLHLEHRPLYNNWTLPNMWGKWRRWARINAEEMLMPLEDLPTFNLPVKPRWTWRRKVLNALSPVLIVPYFVGTFTVSLYRGRETYSPREGVRFALYSAIYSTMVQVYVAKKLYLDRVRPTR
jgi:glycosyltransferase involved in cell wall biosynthesis